MATTKKSKAKAMWAAIIALVLAALYYMKNPNLRAWKNKDGSAVDLSSYPLSWSMFSSNVVIGGSTTAAGYKGVWSGNRITWQDGNYWTI